MNFSVITVNQWTRCRECVQGPVQRSARWVSEGWNDKRPYSDLVCVLFWCHRLAAQETCKGVCGAVLEVCAVVGWLHRGESNHMGYQQRGMGEYSRQCVKCNEMLLFSWYSTHLSVLV